MSRRQQSKITFILPLPASKNRRVEMGSKKTLKIVGNRAVVVTKRVVRSSAEWEAYSKRVFEIVNYELRLKLPHPDPDQRVVFNCAWFLRTERSDCVNCHDLLADALKDAFEIDDRFFLIRDRWSRADAANPRVEIEAYLEREITSPAGSPGTPGT